MTENDLKDALSLAGPDACLAHYRAWAASYDGGFAAGMDYRLPAHVAAAYLATGAGGPVLDVGCGTGLLAGALRDMGFADEIDGADFSPEMLEVAARKGLYSHLLQADITRPVTAPRPYAGLVSSGTFTAGHVGPEALPVLLDLALPGGQFALSVNLRVWEEAGFDRAVATLEQAGRITALQTLEVEIYGAVAATLDPDHASDRASIMLFRAT